MNQVMIAGLGPGNIDYIPPAVLEAAKKADILIGGRRMLDTFAGLGKTCVPLEQLQSGICAYIAEESAHASILVLVAGDPGLYSLLDFLQKKLPQLTFLVIPGISALQYLCARLAVSWEGVATVNATEEASLPSCREAVATHEKTAVFLGGTISPSVLCKYLVSCGFGELSVTVGQKLSFPQETIVTASAEEISALAFSGLCLLFIQNRKKQTAGFVPQLASKIEAQTTSPQYFQDEIFQSALFAKLQLRGDDTVWCLGAGGILPFLCAMACPKGFVYAAQGDVSPTPEKDAGERNLILLSGRDEIFALAPAPQKAWIELDCFANNWDTLFHSPLAGAERWVCTTASAALAEQAAQKLKERRLSCELLRFTLEEVTPRPERFFPGIKTLYLLLSSLEK